MTGSASVLVLPIGTSRYLEGINRLTVRGPWFCTDYYYREAEEWMRLVSFTCGVVPWLPLILNGHRVGQSPMILITTSLLSYYRAPFHERITGNLPA